MRLELETNWIGNKEQSNSYINVRAARFFGKMIMFCEL